MIVVGTCSWAEKTLVASGEFYPSWVRTAEERLRYYASVFRVVEVDSSYYALPSVRNAALWADRTHDGFRFHVKAYGALTGHPVELSGLPRDLRGRAGEGDAKRVTIRDHGLLDELGARFRAALEPLRARGRLGRVLFQFPPYLKASRRALEAVLRTVDRVGLPAAVEFRHGSWYLEEPLEEVVAAFRERGIVLVCADEPQFGSLATVPFHFVATAEEAYFRFHGRNRGNWFRRGITASERFDYLYSDEELESFVPVLLEAERACTRVDALFNNHRDAKAVVNAKRLREILEGRAECVR